MLIYNFGKMYDLISIYKDHFNEEIGESKRTIFLEKSGIINEFFPFFYSHHGKVFIEELLLNHLETIKNGDFETIFQFLFDYKIVSMGLLKFYLGLEDLELIEGNFNSFRVIAQHISESNLSYRLKHDLFSYFLNPISLTQKLVGNMLYMGTYISDLYKSNFEKIAAKAERFDENKLESLNIHLNYINSKEKNTYYSFGIMHAECIEIFQGHDFQVVYLGLNYDEHKQKQEKINLELFGKVLSDPSRIKILDYIQKNGSVTVGDINHIFGYSGTTSYYHLNMMLKARMVITEKQGRNIYYSINKNFFHQACNAILGFCEGDKWLN